MFSNVSRGTPVNGAAAVVVTDGAGAATPGPGWGISIANCVNGRDYASYASFSLLLLIRKAEAYGILLGGT